MKSIPLYSTRFSSLGMLVTGGKGVSNLMFGFRLRERGKGGVIVSAFFSLASFL